MSVSLLIDPFSSLWDSTGAAFAGTMEFYVAGTSTPKDTYTDSTGAVANANPLSITGGRATVYGTDGEPYKIILKDTAGSTLKTLDNVYTATLSDITNNVDAISDLIATNSTTNPKVYVSGYHAAGDGAGGHFFWSASESKANHNGGTIIDPDITFPTDWTNQTQVGTWFTAGSGTGCWKRSDPVDFKGFGGKGDGTTNDSLAFQQYIDTIDDAVFPTGTYLLQSNMTTRAGLSIRGLGSPVFSLQATATTPDLYFLGISAANIKISGIKFNIDRNGQTACTAITFNANASNITIDDCFFVGAARTNNRGMWSADATTVTDIRVANCRFNTLDWAIARADGFSSIIRGLVFSRCSFYDMTDGVNINSPDYLGGTPNNEWTDTVIDSCVFENIVQFPVAFAGPKCRHATVSNNQFRDCDIEAVHTEAGANDIKVIGNSFSLCNTSAGTVGMVSMITGSHDVVISSNTFDQTQNVTGTPICISVQAGGGTEAYGAVIDGNNFQCNSTSTPVFLSNTYGVILSNNRFTNPSTGAKATQFIDASGSEFQGIGNSFYNPAILLRLDDNSYGGLSMSKISGDFTNFGFRTGNTANSTSVVFEGFTVKRAYTADVSATAQSICPAGVMFEGVIGARFVLNGTSQTWVQKIAAKYDGTTFSYTDKVTDPGVSSVAAPDSAAVDWQVASGEIKAGSFSSSTVNGTVSVTFSGIFIP